MPNVLLVTLDTTRADRIGFVSGRSNVTPTIDALAERGTAFTHAFASQPLTGPSHSTILTGQYPFHHSVRLNGAHSLPQSQETLAEVLKAAGYRTHAIVSSFVLDSQFGFDQGFDGYDDDLSAGPITTSIYKEIDASAVASKGIKWLEQKPPDEPFFLWLHFYDPHAPYDPPEEIRKAFPQDPYAGEIHYADRELGRVIESLDRQKLLDKTLIVFTADHGESLGEHGESGHGFFVYDSTTRVPLVFAGPNVPRKKQLADVVSSADILPSILSILGLPAKKSTDGVSLTKLFDGKERGHAAYSESIAPRLTFGWSELRSLRDARGRVVESPRREVYDLADRRESENLYPREESYPPEARRHLSRLLEIKRGDDLTSKAQSEPLDEESQRRLAALGYLSSSAISSKGPLIDPKERIRNWEQFQLALELNRRRRYDEAAAHLHPLIADESQNPVALNALATSLAAARRSGEAADLLKQVIQLDPKFTKAYVTRARLLRHDGNLAEAELLSRSAIQLEPENADAFVTLGDTHLDQRRPAEAESAFRRAYALDPNSTLVISGLGNCLNRVGKKAEAFSILNEGHHRFPTSHAIAYNLAVVTEETDPKAAFALYQKALRIDPEHSMTWNNMGSLLDRTRRRKEAIACIRRAHELDPSNVEATYNLGALLLATGEPESALPLLEEALRQRPTLLVAEVQRARALTAVGRTDEALRVWSGLTDRSPMAWIQIAKIELGRGNRTRAVEALRSGMRSGGKRVEAVIEKDPALQELQARF